MPKVIFSAFRFEPFRLKRVIWKQKGVKSSAPHASECFRSRDYSFFTLKLRKTTGSLWPAKPMKPFVWSRPFGG